MNKQVLKYSLQTLNWIDDKLVDWASAGITYSFTGQDAQLNKYHFGFNFDKAIYALNGKYVFIYQRLGTKGILIKNGEILREINRSYYHSDIYEYPVTFLTQNDITYLVHCPISYNQIDFEEVETGKLVTNIENRNPSDFFHSRLEISPNNKYLISKGWMWHPLDLIKVFNIPDCFQNPLLLDNTLLESKSNGEINTASFINENHLLIGSSKSGEQISEELHNLQLGQIGIWNLDTNSLSSVISPEYEFGNLFSINDSMAWDLYKFPKIINLKTGKIIDQDNDIYSGEQKSSMLFEPQTQPQISFDHENKRLAIKKDEEVIVLTIL